MNIRGCSSVIRIYIFEYLYSTHSYDLTDHNQMKLSYTLDSNQHSVLYNTHESYFHTLSFII